MRELKKVIIHCSATPKSREVSVKEIRKWHKERGFDDIGYHYVIHQDGTIERGRDIRKVGAHCLGQNTHSVGVCYIGGLDSGEAADTMTPKQEKALISLYFSLRCIFGELSLHGHNEFTNKKSCPNFKVKEKFNDLINL